MGRSSHTALRDTPTRMFAAAITDREAKLADRIMPPANADAFATQYPTATVHFFADSGHEVVSQHHTTISKTIRTFLRR